MNKMSKKKKMPKIGKELETQKVGTVNIIEYADGKVLGITSFKNNKVGDREAKLLFDSTVKDNYLATLDEEIDECLNNGYFEMDDYQVFIVHSS